MTTKFFIAGIIGILVASVLVIILRSWNFWLLPIVLSLFLAVIFGIVFTEVNYIVSAIIFLIIASSSLFISFTQNYNLIGKTATSISVSNISQSRFYSSYSFNNAKILKEFESSTSVVSAFGKIGSTYLGKVFVAPIVDETWREGDTITAWVATDLNDKSNNKAEWTKPHKNALRLVGGYIDGYGDLGQYRKAINSSVEKNNLKTRDSAPILVWTADPKNTIKNEQIRCIKIVLASILIWIVMFLFSEKILSKKI